MASHAHGRPSPSSAAVRRLLAAVLIPLLAALALGVVLLWPDGTTDNAAAGNLVADRARGTVLEVQPCAESRSVCPTAVVSLTAGPGAPGEVGAVLPFGDLVPTIEVGDKVVLAYSAEAPEGQQYQYLDFDRRAPVLVLLAAFAVVVVAFARWRGVASLLALAFSLAVFLVFLLPGLIAGESPLALAVVAAGVIMVVTLYLGHGLSVQTSVALLGTLASLTLTGLLGFVTIAASRFTGRGDEISFTLAALIPNIDVSGLVLAGLIVGALGVLDDVTVTQAAVVWELRAADPTAGARRLIDSAMRVGRAHVQATVNTLVLAYLGASLPLLIVFAVYDISLQDALTSEIVAQEVVSGLVGSIGIVAAVPVTTLIAVAIVRRSPVSVDRQRDVDD